MSHSAHSNNVLRFTRLTGTVEWYTPRLYLDASVSTMGAIDLDPASSDRAQQFVRAAKYYTVETDGLSKPWTGRVFLNPPYAMPAIRDFVSKLVMEYQARRVTQAVLLTNNASDTAWFHLALKHCSAICLTRGRISFLQAVPGHITEKKTPTQGQAFFYFGGRTRTFRRVFGQFGTVL